MKLLKTLSILLLLNILLVSCGSKDKTTLALQGIAWKPIKVLDQKVAESSRAEMILKEDLSTNGSSGINRFIGQYKLSEPNGLTFGPLATTKMASLSAEDSAVEDKFFTALTRTKKYKLEKDKLTLLNEQGKVLAIFKIK